MRLFLFLKGNDSIISENIPISSGNPGSFIRFYSVILLIYLLNISAFSVYWHDKIASGRERI